ncbi:MAG: alpha/beta hydrolase [Candidatus Hodarchaeota archaeon]
MSKIEISKKRIILLSLFLTIFVIGTVLIFVIPISVKATYNQTAQTTDGVTISFNVFEPSTSGMNKPAFILGHGSMANKEMMKGYAIELAAAGFVAIPFDFRGHGQSTSGNTSAMFNDVIAIKEYLNTRADIDMNSLGYIGYSMGGLGQSVVHVDPSFKCFIGVGTWLYPTLRTGNLTNPLNVLMIQALFDEAIELGELKESLATRVGISVSAVDANKMYGSFEQENASMIYLDDDSNHLKVAWDQDFIREARNWAINAFDIDVLDENFYVNIRAIILLIQVIGGIGFFFLVVEPFSKLILLSKEERERDAELEIYKIDIPEISIKKLSIKVLIYSLLLGIPGIIIFIPILLILPFAIAGFVVTILFGQTFGLIILLWRISKRLELSFKEILKKPFQGRTKFLRQLALGTILSIILFLISYSSVGLNYFGLVPAVIKIWGLAIFLVICFFINVIYSLLMQVIIQNKFTDTLKDTLKMVFLGFIFPFLYYSIYLLILSGLTRSLFYFGNFIPLSLIMFTLNSSVSIIAYKKTGNIATGAIIYAVLLTFLIVTASTPSTGLSFISRFF